AVERRLVQHHLPALAGLELVDFLAVAQERRDDALGALGVVAEEFGRAELFARREPDRFGRRLPRASPGAAPLLTLPAHRIAKRGDVDAEAASVQGVLRQVGREAVGVVERERGLAVEHVAFLQRLAGLVENREATLERLAEARLFEPQRLGDQRLGARKLR